MARSGLDGAQGPGGWGGARVTHPLFASVVPPLEVQDELFPHRLVSAGGDGKGPVSSAGAGTTDPAAGGSPALAPRRSVSSDARSPRNEPPTATCLILSADPEAPHPHETEPGLQKRGPLGAPGFLPHRGRPSPHSRKAPPAWGGHHPHSHRLLLPVGHTRYRDTTRASDREMETGQREREDPETGARCGRDGGAAPSCTPEASPHLPNTLVPRAWEPSEPGVAETWAGTASPFLGGAPRLLSSIHNPQKSLTVSHALSSK